MIRNLMIFGFVVQFLIQSGISSPSLIVNQPRNSSAAARKPHLSCILFGDTACQITCDVLCNLYGCRSQARCIDQISCDCGEIYTVNSQNLTVSEYENLNLTELWYHNFRKSFVSRRLLGKISHGDPDFSSNLTALLRQPHITGVLAQSELLEIRPKWSLLYFLRATERGHINQMFTTKEGFSQEAFKAYFDQTLDSIVNRTYSQIEKMNNANALPNLLVYLRNEDNIRYIISQILWFPNNTLLNLINDYSRRVKYYNLFHSSNSNLTVTDTENVAFNALKLYLSQAIENLADQVFGKIQEMKLDQELPRLTSYIRNKNDIKSLMSLLLMFPQESMFDLMRNLMMQQRNDTYMISKRSPPQLYILPSDIDEMVTASVLERLLKIKIRTTDLVEQVAEVAATSTTPTTTITTTPQPTTVRTDPIPASFHEFFKRLLKQTFGLGKSEDQQEVNQQSTKAKRNYPELEMLLKQLMEYLVNATNPNNDGAK
ncbi:uncharacterized protein LOC135849677 [Planococcus citri]|uniref:uncharacterized protein LOC135849677 n=1 Tax=Planococcus citri TaxID=170843 RepID=UPI0031F94F80